MAVLQKKFVLALRSQPFWEQVVNDPDLQIEIRGDRDPAVTVYFRGAALLQNLHLERGKLVCKTNIKYLPVDGTDDKSEVQLIAHETNGLVAKSLPKPISIGLGTRELLKRFKDQMQAHNSTVKKEGKLVASLCSSRHNLIVDQEIVLAGNNGKSDRPDLAVARPNESMISLVEVKRIGDSRLLGKHPVIGQLRRYRDAVKRKQEDLKDRFRKALTAKRELGIADDFKAWSGLTSGIIIDPIITLAIGGCEAEDVAAIRQGRNGWGWLHEEELLEYCRAIPFGKTKKLF